MPNTRHRTKALSVQSKRRILVQEEALNWITCEDDLDKPHFKINRNRGGDPRLSEIFSIGVTQKTPKTTLFDIANDFKLEMDIVSWEPDRDYVPLPEVMEAHAENPNLRRLQYMRSQVSIDGKDDADVLESSMQNLRYDYNFNDPYDLMEFVEDKVPGTVTVRLSGGRSKVRRVAKIFRFMEEINNLTKVSRDEFAQVTTMEDLRKIVLDSVVEIKRLRHRHENLDISEVSDADLVLAREMDKRLKTLFHLLKESRWEYNDIFQELNELVEVIEILDNEPSLVDMNLRSQDSNTGKFKRQGGKFKRSRLAGKFKRTFGEDSPNTN